VVPAGNSRKPRDTKKKKKKKNQKKNKYQNNSAKAMKIKLPTAAGQGLYAKFKQ
jgi:hypothetical protein